VRRPQVARRAAQPTQEPIGAVAIFGGTNARQRPIEYPDQLLANALAT